MMGGGDMLPQNFYIPHELMTSKHEYITAEASILVGALVIFYMTVILILFGVNVPCFGCKLQRRQPIIYNTSKNQAGRQAVLDDLVLQEEESLKDLQVMIVNDFEDHVVTEVATSDEYVDGCCLEGIDIV